MTKCLVLCFLLAAVTGASVRGSQSGWPQIATHLVKAGLVLDGSGASPHDATSDESKSCAHVSFSRKLRYGESDLNVLDVATGDVRETSPRPVLLFVAGEDFAGGNGAPDVAGHHSRYCNQRGAWRWPQALVGGTENGCAIVLCWESMKHLS